MKFLDVALRNAARGFRVHPLRGKDAFMKDWPNVATTDEETIRAWAEKFPDYNVGVAAGPDIAVVDSDRVSRLRELCGEHAAEWLSTYSVSSGRPDRAHFYYLMTDQVREFGNKRWAETDIDGNVFELKVHGGQVVAEGSVHPDTGQVYRIVQDLPLIPFPAGLLSLMREHYLKANPTGKREWALPVHDGQGRDDFLTQQAGRLRHVGASEAVIRAHLEEINSDPSVIADPKNQEDLDRIARSVARYDVPAPEPIPVFGRLTASTGDDSEDAECFEDAPRPKYPDDVWDGTAYGEFADLCARGNFIPKKFFSEAIRTVIGALIGDRLRCPITGVNPRAYTIIIGPPGCGKGTTVERLHELFCYERWDGLVRTESPMLWSDPSELIWRGRVIGAQIIIPASAPGLMKAIEPRKLKKGETANPMECWKPLPRIITIAEEVRNVFANFENESTGAGLESVLCELYDRDSFTTTVTKDRGPQGGRLLYSLLGGITKEGWDAVFSKTQSVESGFLSRINIVGSEEARTTGDISRPDFEALRNRFFPVVQDLEKNPRTLDAAPSAKAYMSEWFSGLELPEGISRARLNIWAWRTALHLAWLHGHGSILEADVDGGIRVAEYQTKMREFYAPPEGETRQARCEQTIRKVVRGRRRLTVRQLRQTTNYKRFGIGLWEKSLTSLVKAGELRIEQSETGKKTVILLKEKD